MSELIIGHDYLTASHLEFLQHDCLICEAEVAVAETELLGQFAEVHL